MLTVHLVTKNVGDQSRSTDECASYNLFPGIINGASGSRFNLLSKERIILLPGIGHSERIGSPTIKHKK